MAVQTFTQEEVAKNLKRIRKERKLNQKQLAALLDKSERTIQNYEAGETDFSISMLKDIAIALDIDWWELIGQRVEIPIASQSEMDKYRIDNFGDIVNLLFKLQETYDVTMGIQIAKPPEDMEWKAGISIDGKGNRKYDADFCLFLENWRDKLDMLCRNLLSMEGYREWQRKTVAYYSCGEVASVQGHPDIELCILENREHIYRWKNPDEDVKDR